MRFADRWEAGRALADRLRAWLVDGQLVDPLVLALPRGGVPVAAEVARALRAPLDVLVARKIGMPGRPEVGIGAVVGADPPLFAPRALEALGLTEQQLAPDVARERVELRRREDLYRRGMAPLAVRGRTVLLIDDGLATGVTARAALRHLRGRQPARLILAVPVCGPASPADPRREADDFLAVHQPPHFRGVGEWYENFDQVQDSEVIDILHRLGSAV
ncbi:phosphoribosyltransferase [Streptomyces sp. NPDC017993]|uniref:phosphoribosyltransferase n=1 Tax=Streptomyces sp. NPDC017993 TaxID=3365027 RepID=UPI0037BD7CE6